jgi:hypothetical protein
MPPSDVSMVEVFVNTGAVEFLLTNVTTAVFVSVYCIYLSLFTNAIRTEFIL